MNSLSPLANRQNDGDLPASSSAGTWIDCSQTINEYVSLDDWRVQANANTGFSHAGMINSVAGKIVANYWLDEVYSAEAAAAHRSGDIHIHDLDCLTGYCVGWSLRQLLTEGFNGVPGRVAARPPRHLREALGQMANFMGVLQAEWAGAQAFSSFDTYLAPYLFLDRLSDRALFKALRQFVHNLNVPARWGQSPFTNITLDISVPGDLADQTPMRGSEHLFHGLADETLLDRLKQRDAALTSLDQACYRHFLPEMERIGIALYDVLTAGDSNGQPFTFPIPTVNITEDFDWDGPVAEAIFRNTATMGNSYFQNFIGSQYVTDEHGVRRPNPDAYQPGAVRSMCCRLQLDLRELLKRGNGLFGSAEMTGSLGVVTLNMARIGYLARGSEAGLFAQIDRLMDVAHDSLERKRRSLDQFYQAGLYPYTRRYLPSFANHFHTIGVNGMNEMLRNWSGDRFDMSMPEGIALSLRLLEHMRQRLSDYQEASGNLYNLEATPAEGTTYSFAKLDHARYPDILQAGSAPHIYYTNSSQLPVGHTDDPFEVLALQDELQCKYTGGTVLHLYMGEAISSPAACKTLVRRVLEQHRLPYITITPVFSVCDTHGYLKGQQETCPHCGEPTQVWTRVMGYYRPVQSFNIGKRGEHGERRHFVEPVHGMAPAGEAVSCC